MDVAKAYLIDPEKREVVPIELGGGVALFPQLYKLMECRTIEALIHLDKDVVWVDEEALFKEPDPYKAHWWAWHALYQPMTGKAVVIGEDRNSSFGVSVTMPIQDVLEMVCFLSIQQAKLRFDRVDESIKAREKVDPNVIYLTVNPFTEAKSELRD